MTSKLMVACDLDGVLSDTIPGGLNAIRAGYGLPPMAMPRNHDLDNYSQQDYEYTVAEFRKPEVYLASEPFPCVAQMLDTLLVEHNLGLVYVTGRPHTQPIMDATAAWLHKYRFPHADVLFVSKQVHKGSVVRSAYGQAAVIAIEDSMEAALSYDREGMATFVLRRPYNLHLFTTEEYTDLLSAVYQLADITDALWGEYYQGVMRQWLERLGTPS